jgi:Lysylphosphatidylglycerol synthase TM region
MRNVLRGIGSIAISAGILWLLLRETGQSAQEGLQALWTISWGVWGIYTLAQLLQGWLRAIRYRVLLAGAKANPLPAPGRMFGVTLARNMFVDMLPARAGELMYWALLNRGEGVPSKDCLSSMTLSIWFDFLALAAVLAFAVAVPMLDAGGRMLMLWGGIVAGGVVLVGGVALFYGPQWACWILARFPERLCRWRVLVWLNRFLCNLSDSFCQVRGAGIMGRVTLLSIGIRIVKYAGLAVAFYGVAAVLRPALAELPVWQMLIGLISGEGGAALPIPTFMSLGTYEAAGAGAMSLTGVVGSDAAVVLLGTHVVSQLVDYSIGGLALLGLLWGKRRQR